MGRIIAVASGKGGTGKSTVTVGLGTALASMEKRVLMIDADIGLRCLDIIVNLAEQSVYHWEDILSSRCMPDQAILPVPSCQGLFLLSAPANLDREYPVGILDDLCGILSENYDYVLIDCPAGIGSKFEVAVSPASEVLVVTTGDQISLRCAASCGEAVKERGIQSVRLVLNEFRTYPIELGVLPNLDEVVDIAGIQMLGIVPYDAGITFSASRGRQVLANNKATPAFARIARRLEGEALPLPAFHEIETPVINRSI